MADNKLVLDPGWRAFDANGDVYSGAKLKVFQAGTTTPRTVYSDDDLSSSLGSVITCDSGGYPTSDGNAKTLVYTGLNAYKLQLYTSEDVLVWTHDDIPGALDTSGFGGDTRATSPVSSVSTDQVLAASDSGKLYNVNCSGGAVLFTLGAAATLEDGWRVGIRHNGSANQVKIVTTGGELIALPDLISTTAFAIATRGQEIWLRCNGSGFIVGETAEALLNTVGVINITDRLSDPPVSPTAGARYILLTTPTGAWSTFSQHDIVEANGQGGWIRYTPAADCGWLAYVQDEDLHYTFLGSAWAVLKDQATQSDMETPSSILKIVNPGVQKYHPGHPKGWLSMNGAGTIAIRSSHNVSGITDNGNGDYTASWTAAFSSTEYGLAGFTANTGSATGTFLSGVSSNFSQNTGSVRFITLTTSSVGSDNQYVDIIAVGDQ